MTKHETERSAGAGESVINALNLLSEKSGFSGARNDRVPAPGDIWRARWNGTSILVLVRAIDSTQHSVQACVVSLDADLADERTVVLPSTETTLTAPVAVWREIERSLPELALDALISVVAQRSFEALWPSQEKSGVDLRFGLPSMNIAGDRRSARRHAHMALEALSAAAEVLRAPTRAILVSPGTKPSELASELGIDVQSALQLIRDAYVESNVISSATPHEQPIESRTGNPSGYPPDLQTALSAFACGQHVRRTAASLGARDSEVLQTLARTSFALAARGESRDKRDWPSRVARAMELVGGGE